MWMDNGSHLKALERNLRCFFYVIKFKRRNRKMIQNETKSAEVLKAEKLVEQAKEDLFS